MGGLCYQMEKLQLPGQCIYYIQQAGKKDLSYSAGSRRHVLLNSIGAVSVGEPSSNPSHWGEEEPVMDMFCTHYQYSELGGGSGVRRVCFVIFLFV